MNNRIAVSANVEMTEFEEERMYSVYGKNDSTKCTSLREYKKICFGRGSMLEARVIFYYIKIDGDGFVIFAGGASIFINVDSVFWSVCSVLSIGSVGSFELNDVQFLMIDFTTR